MKRILIGCLAAIVLFNISLSAQTEPPKKELRAVWFATVWNLDWPPAAYKIRNESDAQNVQRQKDMLITYLNRLQTMGINTFFFQVRSMCDALYNSKYEPWGTPVVTSRGMNPGYDPLGFAIEEAHKRGIELHAWLNPYRYESVAGTYTGPNDYRTTHPAWLLDYPAKGDKAANAILDPANPEVIQRIKSVVGDILSKYDVDGIVFDDYFYAYGGTDAAIDAASAAKWKPANMSLHDWRRDNVNRMVKACFDTIQAVKPYVRYGLSPFGIWTTQKSVADKHGITLPAGISGLDAYSDIYCDPVAWLDQQSVDYVSPQLYWPTYQTAQSYLKLAPWWSDVTTKYDRHFYSSHSISAIDAPTKSVVVNPQEEIQWFENKSYFQDMPAITAVEAKSAAAAQYQPSELKLQIESNRKSTNDGAPGSVFYSAKYFLNISGVEDYMKANVYQNSALWPALHWKKHEEQTVVTNLTLSGSNLSWSYGKENVRYVVYAIAKSDINKAGNFTTSKYLVGVAYNKTFTVPSTINSTTHAMAVAVLDRFGNEFAPVVIGHTPSANQAAQLVAPADKNAVGQNVTFAWNAVQGVESYTIQIAKDATFNTIIYTASDLTTPSFNNPKLNLFNGQNYYWRVKTRKIGVADVWSSVYMFQVNIMQPVITSPTSGTMDVEPDFTTAWTFDYSGAYTYELQIGTSVNFEDVFYQKTAITSKSFKMTDPILTSLTNYFVRVRALYDGGASIWSAPIEIKIKEIKLDPPTILSPASGEEIQTLNPLLKVESIPNCSSYRIEISTSESFPPKTLIVQKMDSASARLSTTLQPNTLYYIRARAYSGLITTSEYSTVKTFSTGNIQNIGEHQLQEMVVYSTNKHLFIENPLDGEMLSIQLVDLSGRVLRQEQTSDAQIGLDLTDFSSGIYICKIGVSGQVTTRKIIL